MDGVFEKLALVRTKVDQAARRAGRSPSEIDVLAVTKYAPEASVRELLTSGKVKHAGESRVQDAGERFPGVEYHFIGRLQSNKAKKAAELYHWVDSVDSLELAERLDRAAGEAGKKLKVLVQIREAETLAALVEAVHKLEHLDLRGLMAMAPKTETAEEARPHFKKYKKLLDSSFPASAAGAERPVLSMGMSSDFEVAVEEGATLVRIGSFLFGESS